MSTDVRSTSRGELLARKGFLLQSATTLTAFHETATWATLPEIRLVARMAGLEVTSVRGSYAREEYDSRSREMLMVLERK